MLCIMHFGRKSRIGEAPGRWSEWCRLLSLLSMMGGGGGGGHIQHLFTTWTYMYRCTIRPTSHYTPYECFNMANQNSWKVGVFGRKLEGRHSQIHFYFDQYQRKASNDI